MEFNYKITMNNGNEYRVKSDILIAEFIKGLFGNGLSPMATHLATYKKDYVVDEDWNVCAKEKFSKTGKGVVVLSTYISEVIYDCV